MVSDWPQMETMHLNGEVDNSSDLFGGDLFSDELLDIYNSSEGADDSTGHEVPLSNGKCTLLSTTYIILVLLVPKVTQLHLAESLSLMSWSHQQTCLITLNKTTMGPE